jgi:hypothetical protein
MRKKKKNFEERRGWGERKEKKEKRVREAK